METHKEAAQFHWRLPQAVRGINFDTFRSGMLLYKNSNQTYILASISGIIYTLTKEFQVESASYFFYTKDEITSLSDFPGPLSCLIGAASGYLYIFNTHNRCPEEEIQIAKAPIQALTCCGSNQVVGILSGGEIFLCTLHARSAILRHSLKFVTLYPAPNIATLITPDRLLALGKGHLMLYDLEESKIHNQLYGVSAFDLSTSKELIFAYNSLQEKCYEFHFIEVNS